MNINYLLEALTQENQEIISKIENAIINNNSIAPFLIRVMPFKYKKKYSINVMFNHHYSKKRKYVQSLLFDIIDNFSKHGIKVKIQKDNVIKIIIDEKA